MDQDSVDPSVCGTLSAPAAWIILPCGHCLLNWTGLAGLDYHWPERDPRNVEGSLKDVTASLHYLRSIGF